MILKRFVADGFRNIDNCDISFMPGVNLLYGNNAQGKTNVIEGIYLFARGKSFRAREDKDLLEFGRDGYRLYIEYEDNLGRNTLEFSSFGRERRRKKNGYPLKSVRELLGNIRCVLFYPDDLSLVKESPDYRRSFLNIAIGQLDSLYIEEYSRYKIALENKNCILKNASKGKFYDENELLLWSYQMAEFASLIYLKRVDYLKKLELYAKEVLLDISENLENLSFSYKRDIENDDLSKDIICEMYKKIFTENIEKEKIVGTSLYGPHRDDIEILINGISARSFASQGQQRSIVLAMKLAEGDVCKNVTGEYPIYLFDDVLSELDEGRKKYVLSRVKEKQIIITSCDEELLLTLADNVIYVEGGKYSIRE